MVLFYLMLDYFYFVYTPAEPINILLIESHSIHFLITNFLFVNFLILILHPIRENPHFLQYLFFKLGSLQYM